MSDTTEKLRTILSGVTYPSISTPGTQREFMPHHIDAIAAHLLDPENLGDVLDVLIAEEINQS